MADRTVEDDVRLVEHVLREVLRDEIGPAGLAALDGLRAASQGAAPGAEMQALARTLDLDLASDAARALSFHFLLLNVVEDLDRLRRLRDVGATGEPVPQSLEDTFRSLQARGLSLADARRLLDAVDVRLVFTAHPTEPKRRTILERLRRVQALFLRLERERLLPKETAALQAELVREVRGLWQSDELRFRTPRVVDEIRLGLFYFDHVVLDLVPAFARELEGALVRVYGSAGGRLPSVLRFGSWRGSDMDGNPSVTPDSMRDAARLQRSLVLERYASALYGFIDVLTQSARFVPASDALLASLARDKREHPKVWRDIRAVNRDEHHRAKVTFMAHKVDAALARRRDGYVTPDELLADLRILQASLRENGAAEDAQGPVEDLLRQVESFGFHLASLDLRLHARDVGSAVAQILASAEGTKGYARMREADKVRLLTERLGSRFRPKRFRVTGEGARVVEALRALGEIQDGHGEAMMHTVVLSMASEASDLLEVLLLAKVLRLVDLREGFSRIDVCPLFEMIGSLAFCGETMAALYRNPSYRKHLRARGSRQEVQIGYSDSMKDGGIFASRWALYRAQQSVAGASDAAGIELTVFHGRGGSVSRGGEPTFAALQALPPEVLTGRIKVTEQGEVLSSKYFHPEVALRETEQFVGGLLRAMGAPPPEPEAAWVASMDRMAKAALLAYQDLVVRDPGLALYFEQASPIREIGELNIGSRPASRRGSFRIEDLRAIPWVFAWMQNRHVLPGWYSIGSALAAETDRELVARMIRDWPRFAVLLDMGRMVLEKADMEIASRYASLVTDDAVRRRIFGRMVEEHDRTARALQDLLGGRAALDSDPLRRESLSRRLLYLAPLGYIQAELLERKRRSTRSDPELLRAILLTINGIAHGLRNTG